MGTKTEAEKAHNREYMKRWRATDHGKNYISEYRKRLRTPEGKAKRSAQAKRYYRSDVGRAYKRRARMAEYGITVEEFEALKERQNNCCAICGRDGEENIYGVLNVDHDHETGKVRELLCSNCNHALGKFGDDPVLLDKAAAYLRKHSRG